MGLAWASMSCKLKMFVGECLNDIYIDSHNVRKTVYKIEGHHQEKDKDTGF